MSILNVKNLSYTYHFHGKQEVRALSGLNFSVEAGEFVGIMGQTGCGKTTLIQLLAGLLVPTEGEILLNGQDIQKKEFNSANLRKKVGVVFQFPEYQLFESTVQKDVIFGLKHRALSKKEKEQRGKNALELMGFDYETIRNQSPLSLSGGEKRRIAIAGILAGEPELLILDEPVAGLDPKMRDRFMKILKALNKKGVTILMISHHTDLLCEYASRILVLSKGNLVMDGTPKEVFSEEERTKEYGIGTCFAKRIAGKLKKREVLLSDQMTSYGELLEEICRLEWEEKDIE